VVLNVALFIICALFGIGFILSVIEWIFKSEKRKGIFLACVALYIIGGLIYAFVNFLFVPVKNIPDWQYNKEQKEYIDKIN
jgi:hypothetical protein